MTSATPERRPSTPPARQLRLLANLAPAAAVVFGLVTCWLVVTTLRDLAQPVSSAVVVSLVVGTLAAALAAVTTWRLGVEVPQVLRGWQAARAERDAGRDQV